MAITVRRTKAAQAEQENEEQEFAQQCIEINLQVRAQLRELWFATRDRMARGLVIAREKAWEWEEPDWEADPETWPGMAKILYLWVTLLRIEHDLSFLEAAATRMPLCANCYPEKPEHGRYVRVFCEEHSIQHRRWSAQHMAHLLYDSPGLTLREEQELAAGESSEGTSLVAFVTPLCGCGHKRAMHDSLKTFCLEPGCTCQTYRGEALRGAE